ncbi:16S rRNA (cytosine(967)-C(5))-methyltransferase RsmB [Listeria monocytogenes]|uniref:16S rRNA (cytosine(967)-C(5))-methyltransferase RsmB n=1 Tax=Listeria monocytogenes TaxID=1639 RepID=UPI001365BAA5|nr:16S rRNA (cytosine(967)-C(5))-methyltransferase RsmB [Listeria monocytogenes]MWA89725.1 16S rRNA (cytosine(967)-C(5))-methyltransferase RsmB [Listeria monocytogenes]
MKKQKTVRAIALELIIKIENNQSYSHLLINDALKKQKLNPLDKGLLTELVYGTTQRKITLDYYLAPFLNKEPDNWVKNLLRMSVYQLTFLDKVPEHAILNEAGDIAKDLGHQGVTKFVNGVLRNVIRKGVPSIDAIKDPVQKIAVETSLPEWLAKRWADQYGIEKLREIGLAFLVAPHQSIRVNQTEIPTEQLIKELNDQGITVTRNEFIEEAFLVEKGSVAETKAYKDGKCSIQDESSMLAAYALQLEDNLTVLDACAAPGGKTTHIAEKMHGTGMVHALDIHEKKTKLIDQAAKRLQLLNIRTAHLDARTASTMFEPETFDRILVDAPCSGFGVLRRKPDIKYAKTEKDIHKLAEIQLAILDDVSQLVKENGILVYSTCTIDKEENETVLRAFLEKHPEFTLEPVVLPEKLAQIKKDDFIQLLPTDIGSDGFFVSSLRKVKS